MKKIFTLLILLFVSQNSFAIGRFSASLGWGELYALSSIRLGVSSVEVGKFNLNTYAVTQNYTTGNSYVAFGPAIVKGGVGIYGGAGYDFTFINLIFLKTELNVSSSFSNVSEGSAIIGLGLYW